MLKPKTETSFLKPILQTPNKVPHRLV